MSKAITYTQLDSLTEEAAIREEELNLYGVILDATFPYRVDKKFFMTARIVDSTTLEDDEFVNVLFVAKEFSDLPIIHRIGDILRIHRAQLHYFKEKK